MTVYAITDTKKGRTGIAPTYLQTTLGGETSSEWAKRPGGETSRGRNVLVAKHPGGETSSEGAKRPGGETSKGRNVLLPIYVGRIWQIAHWTKCAARLIKCAHLTNLHTCAAFRRGKV